VKKLSFILIITGLVCIIFSGSIFLLTFYPVMFEEVKYSVAKISKPKAIVPVDREFGIVIPKIQANTKVIANVNPFNEREYQIALTKGIAHARGTSMPGHAGNSFIFAHSAGDWFNANRYNAVFYLLSKLQKGDEIDAYYKQEKYVYKVIEIKYVDANQVQYLGESKKNTSTITLMTCWPPGTTLKRLIVIGEIK
jgi:sortase A